MKNDESTENLSQHHLRESISLDRTKRILWIALVNYAGKSSDLHLVTISEEFCLHIKRSFLIRQSGNPSIQKKNDHKKGVFDDPDVKFHGNPNTFTIPNITEH